MVDDECISPAPEMSVMIFESNEMWLRDVRCKINFLINLLVPSPK